MPRPDMPKEENTTQTRSMSRSMASTAPTYSFTGDIDASFTGIQEIMATIGLKKTAINLLAAHPSLRYLHNYNCHKNPNVKATIRQIFFSHHVPLKNSTKAEQFVDFYSNYCLPSQRRMLLEDFDGYAWADFLETKSREDALRQPPFQKCLVMFFFLAVIVASAIVPAVILGRPTLDRTQTILDSICLMNNNSNGNGDGAFQIPVDDCDDVTCVCCRDRETNELCTEQE